MKNQPYDGSVCSEISKASFWEIERVTCQANSIETSNVFFVAFEEIESATNRAIYHATLEATQL